MSADAVAIVRFYPPMVICFAAALAGTALVFDIFYLVASPGLTLAMVYTVPVLAGLIAGLVAAADDVELERRVLVWTILATVAAGITNVVVVAMIAAMRRTGPSDWKSGWHSVLFAGCSVIAVAVMVVVFGGLIRTLGLELKTVLPKKKVAPPPAAPAKARPAKAKSAVSKEAAARAKPAEEPGDLLGGSVDTMFDDSDERTVEEVPGEAGRRVEPVPALTPPSYLPPLPTAIDLDEARPVMPSEGSGHADRRTPRSRRIPAVPPSRRPGRRGNR
ncbi:hypothetical protein [Kribbella sp. CA-293567]|uniref:hypothetical protein n=1 Tax=Kribbella sp. CA-293567 TaxID=3002436 RepID=UPI0022DDCB94|nr:hypothetical protein [Kribbella sp. CA-293567]WBQ03545.1 hypothetical protein OX958_26675 [Kribbella sp. CA-293567]